ncbi:MAG: class I SAM-dependent methyltransferase [Pseudobdellovibrio sp.]
MPFNKKYNKIKLPFDKYELYSKAVQSPEEDVKFYRRVYKKFRHGKKPLTLREDFCGTGMISCEWVKLDPEHKSCGLDLDQEPMGYGRDHYIPKLTPDQQHRIALIKKDVLTHGLASADIAVAVNFSYFLFKKRDILKRYFENVYQSLNRDGIFVLDIFGGTQCTDAIEDTTRHKGFTYYWDQQNFDPVTNEAYFEIHFKYGKKKYEGVFTYDWRMWSILEIRELMAEVGFQETVVYWEGTDKKGFGNGIFTPVKKGEACESWIAYIAGAK